MTLIFIATLFCGTLYAASFCYAIFCALKKRTLENSGFYGIYSAAVIVQIALLIFGFYSGAIWLSQFSGLTLSVSCLLAVICALMSLFSKNTTQLFVSSAVCAVFIFAPMLCGVGSFKISQHSGVVLALHGILAAVSYAFTACGAICGLMLLLQARSLQNKSSDAFSRATSPLERLAKLVRFCAYSAFVSMFSALGLGLVAFAKCADFSALMILKLCAGSCVLILQFLLAFYCAKNALSGKKSAWCAIALFISAMLLLLLVEYRTLIK